MGASVTDLHCQNVTILATFGNLLVTAKKVVEGKCQMFWLFLMFLKLFNEVKSENFCHIWYNFNFYYYKLESVYSYLRNIS